MKPRLQAIPVSTRLNARLLAALKSAADRCVKQADLAHAASISGLRLQREIERLRLLGYGIDQTEAGLKLTCLPDLLLPDEIRDSLDTRVIGREVVVYEQLGSTNDAAWQLAADGAEEGLVVFAEEQTAGRGRLGRQWFSPSGGLWMSIVLCPDPPAERATPITLAAAVAIACAIRRHLGCDATIRWPNDVLVCGKKVAGLMIETRSERLLQGVFILGIGVNVNCTQFPDDIEQIATSLCRHTDQPIRRVDLARAILQAFDGLYGQILLGEHEAIGNEWLAMSSTLGQRITIMRNGRTYKGEVVDMDPSAGLMVRLDSGFVRPFKGEHVTVVK